MIAELLGQFLGIILLFGNVYFSWKVAKKFRRNGAWSLFLLIPLLGPFLFWTLLSTKRLFRKADMPWGDPR